eukprot:NODE_251_length_11743_cov_0.676788.p7 type:complete len:125 gc:universal NODE_251_length_11743_cov_0.676788:11201-11575(+)
MDILIFPMSTPYYLEISALNHSCSDHLPILVHADEDIDSEDIILAKQEKIRLNKFKEFTFDEFNHKIYPIRNHYKLLTASKLRLFQHTFYQHLSEKNLDSALDFLGEILIESANHSAGFSRGRK